MSNFTMVINRKSPNLVESIFVVIVFCVNIYLNKSLPTSLVCLPTLLPNAIDGQNESNFIQCTYSVMCVTLLYMLYIIVIVLLVILC